MTKSNKIIIEVITPDIIIPDDYPTIQQGIDAASAGDVILVKKGTYSEHITINKELTLVGKDRDTTIIDAGGSGKCIHILSDYYGIHDVKITGFTIQNTGSEQFDAGVLVDHISFGSKISIENCTIKNAECGIYFLDSAPVGYLISVKDCHITSNDYVGVLLEMSDHITLENNLIDQNEIGVFLNPVANYNRIYNNTISNNSWYGISLDFYCSNNEIVGNTIESNGGGAPGIYSGLSIIDYSWSNKIYHNNFINNTPQASDDSDKDQWDNGPTDGGNYWSDHVCHGDPSNGSEPYYITSFAIDHYPFEHKDGWRKT